MNKKASEMTVDEFSVELMLMWDDVVTIPTGEREKNNRSDMGRQSARKGGSGLFNGGPTKLSMRRGDNGYKRGKYDNGY